ncbi:meiosis expressed gene 1 protein homolog [Hyperolius riggenbachi]|uniref:meiosis expressed gene 1 protein homolog n=1 Tax=Hyperolius riggenbachi TaxID=752182 RepID=UPI0035A265C7
MSLVCARRFSMPSPRRRRASWVAWLPDSSSPTAGDGELRPKCRGLRQTLKIAGMSGEDFDVDLSVKPKSMSRAKQWSDEIENLYRFQTAGYRDEMEYKHIKQVAMVERWPDTGFVKKLQRKDNTFYYYNKQRECEEKEVHKVKVYAY